MHLSSEQMALAFGSSVEAEDSWVFSLGTQGVSETYFKHDLPSAHELELAIAAIEDEISRFGALNGSRFRLFTSDPIIHEILIQAGVSDESDFPSLHITAVEQLFGRLASVAEGQPLSYAKIPTNREFSAALVILRELMHHLHFSEIRYLEPV